MLAPAIWQQTTTETWNTCQKLNTHTYLCGWKEWNMCMQISVCVARRQTYHKWIFFFGLRKNEKCLFNGFLLQYLWIFWTQNYKVNNYVFIKRWMNNIKTCRHVYIMCAERNDSWLDNRFFCRSLLRCENGICDEIIF